MFVSMPTRSIFRSAVRSFVVLALSASGAAFGQLIVQPPGSGGGGITPPLVLNIGSLAQLPTAPLTSMFGSAGIIGMIGTVTGNFDTPGKNIILLQITGDIVDTGTGPGVNTPTYFSGMWSAPTFQCTICEVTGIEVTPVVLTGTDGNYSSTVTTLSPNGFSGAKLNFYLFPDFQTDVENVGLEQGIFTDFAPAPFSGSTTKLALGYNLIFDGFGSAPSGFNITHGVGFGETYNGHSLTIPTYNAFEVFANADSGTNITNYAALYAHSVVGLFGTLTNPHGVIIESGAGNSGFGLTAPVALIEAGAGTSGNPSFRLDPGTVDPTCSAGHIGSFWIDSTSAVTTHLKVCVEVVSTPTWVSVI